MKHLIHLAAHVIVALASWASAAELVELRHDFAPNLVPLASVLQAPNTNGGEIRGVGNGDWEKHPLQRGLGSWVYPDTATDEALITLTGTNWHLHDFSLHGCEPGTAAPATLPKAGILVKFAKGVGTGGNTIERVNVSDVVAALRFGDVGDKSMCDTTTASKLNIKNVDYAALVTHRMAMTNNFEAVVAYGIRKAAFRFDDGGCSEIRSCSLTRVFPAVGEQAALLSLGNPSSNCWTYTLANCKIDRQCGSDACLIDMDRPIGGTVLVSQCHAETSGYGSGKYLLNLCAGVRITIIGGSNLLQQNSIFVKPSPWPFNPPEVVAINHERCASPAEMVAPGSGPVFLKCISCGTQDSTKPVGRMQRFYFNNVVDRSKEALR